MQCQHAAKKGGPGSAARWAAGGNPRCWPEPGRRPLSFRLIIAACFRPWGYNQRDVMIGDFYRAQRQRMVEEQLQARDIRDRRVLDAMGRVPRHAFVPRNLRSQAYADRPLPIGLDQTISQPYVVALMTQLISLQPQETVLEIGTGSGYQAAILGHLAFRVYSIERLGRLARQARRRIERLGLKNVEVLEADGSLGLPDYAPYSAILVAAAAPSVPQPLLHQLVDGGRLVIPVGSRAGQVLERWTRHDDEFSLERMAPVAFVPLVGEHGWDPEAAPASWWH
jgi:protein-L-isoaspartate(D-aspartate) O-methyltransferase